VIAPIDFNVADFVPDAATDLFPRSIVAQAQRAMRQYRVLVAQAGPGHGKTGLLTYLYQQHPGMRVWLRLTPADNDAQRLLQKLVHALARNGIQLSDYEQRWLLACPAHQCAEFLLKLLPDEIETVLFLDDVHHLTDDTSKDLLRALCGGQGRALRIVMATDGALPFDISPLLLANRVYFITHRMLLLDDDEALAFLGKATGPVRRMVEFGEGWLAPLVMLKRQLEHAVQPGSIEQDFYRLSHGLADYLEHQVLQQADAAMQTALIRLAATERFTLAQACFMLDDVPMRLLQSLCERHGALISSEEKGYHWYRFPRIYREFLLQRQRQRLQRRDVLLLQARAAHWLHDHRFLADAITLGMACEAWEPVALWLEEYTRLAKQKGNHEQLLLWLKVLPQDVVRQHPALQVALALCLMLRKQFVSSDSSTFLLGEMAQQHPDNDRYIQRVVPLLFMANQALKDTIDGLHANIVYWLTQWQDDAAFRTDADFHLETGLARLIEGFCCKCESRFSDGNVAFNKARQAFQAYGSDYGIAWTDALHTLLLAKQGLHYEALSKARDGLAFVRRHLDAGIDIEHMLSALMAAMYYEQAEFTRAAEFLPADLGVIRDYGYTDIMIAAFQTRIHLLWEAGEVATAIDELKAFIKVAESSDLFRAVFVLVADLVILLLGEHRDDEARQYARTYLEDQPAPLAALSNSLSYRATIYLALADQDYHKAHQLIDQRIQVQQTQHRYRILAEYYRLRALAFYQQGQLPQALEAFADSLALAASRQYLALYAHDREVMLALLDALPTRSLSAPVRQFVVTLRKKVLYPRSAVVADADLLTRREIAIIRRAEIGEPNAQLAAALNLTEGTLKWHLHNIYQKLQVRNRSAAIRRARELGYFQGPD